MSSISPQDNYRSYKNWRHLLANPERKNRLFDYSIVREGDYDHDPMEHEATCCARFGCGKHLSLLEQLFGKYCISHQPAK